MALSNFSCLILPNQPYALPLASFYGNRLSARRQPVAVRLPVSGAPSIVLGYDGLARGASSREEARSGSRPAGGFFLVFALCISSLLRARTTPVDLCAGSGLYRNRRHARRSGSAAATGTPAQRVRLNTTKGMARGRPCSKGNSTPTEVTRPKRTEGASERPCRVRCPSSV